MVGGGEAPRGDKNKDRKELSPADQERAWLETGAEFPIEKMLPIELSRIGVRCSARAREIKNLAEETDELKADISIGENTEENQAKLTAITQQLGAHADDAFHDWEQADAIVLANHRNDSENPEPGYEDWNNRLQSEGLKAWRYVEEALYSWTDVFKESEPDRARTIEGEFYSRNLRARERNEQNHPLS